MSPRKLAHGKPQGRKGSGKELIFLAPLRLSVRLENLIDLMRRSLLCFAVALVAAAATAIGAESSWVRFGADGRLTYQTWGNGNRIMDFSHAGYMGGGVKLPDVPTVQTLNPSGGDDRTALQNAINAVATRPLINGFRGALQLGPGTFRVSGQINITASGIVVRGAGSGEGGTTILMTASSTMTLFSIRGSGSPAASGAVNITDSYVPSGTTSFNVSSVSGFSVGQNVLISRPVTADWIEYVRMHNLVRDGQPQTWLSAGSTITTDRTIAAISGNKITLDAPLTDSFDSQYLGSPVGTMARYTWSGRIAQVGLENLRIEAPPVAEAYRSITMSAIIDSWIRNVVIQDGVNCLTLDRNTKRITVDNVTITHTVPSTSAAGPSDFAGTGTQILFNKCQALGTGSWPFVTHTIGTGPIVVLNFFSTQRAGISPHQRWCTGVLADHCELPNAPQQTQGIAFRNRGTAGSGQGWTTAWSVAWNVTTPYFLVSAAPGTQNWCLGGIGVKTSRVANGDPDGIYESLGAKVTLGKTNSLYLEQLRERLGSAALVNIGYDSPPTISAIADQSIGVNTATGALSFTIGDAETAPDSLTLAKNSSNTTLVPLSGIAFGGVGPNRSVTVTPAANQTGAATITVTVGDGELTANRTFTVTVTATASESWRIEHFGTAHAVGDAADDADPDGDGVVNLLEFALNGDPRTAHVGILPAASREDGDFTLTYTRRKNALGELDFVVEASSEPGGSWDSNGVAQQVVHDTGALETVRARVSIAGEPRKFLRLRVTRK